MKEKLIQEISNAMTDILSVEQMAQLNGVLLQVVSKYTITEDGEKAHEEAASNDRLLEIFLSAKQVEGCTTPTIKYYGSTIRQLFKKMPKKVTNYTTEDIRAYLAVFQRKHKSSKVTIDNIRRIFLHSLHGSKKRITSSKVLYAGFIRSNGYSSKRC